MSTLSTGKRVTGFVFLGIIFLFALEGIARIVFRDPPYLNQTYVSISSGFPDLTELIEDTQQVPPTPRYYDEFLYAAGPVSTKHITFTEYYSARRTPASVPLHQAEIIVWTFGGSTMENTETTDQLSIANTWAAIFNERLGSTHVKNFGTGGFFSSYELIKFQKLLREVPESEIPTIAIFYDGYNDALYGYQYGPGRMQQDLSLKLKALVERRNATLWLYSSSEILSGYSRLWERSGARAIEFLLFPLPAVDADEADLAGAVRNYIANVRMAQAICVLYEIRCFFLLQPLIVTKQPLSTLEQDVLERMEAHPRFGAEGSAFVRRFYAEAALQLQHGRGFLDASAILDGRAQPDFYDLGHTSAQSSAVIGQRTAELILAELPQSSAAEQPFPANLLPAHQHGTAAFPSSHPGYAKTRPTLPGR